MRPIALALATTLAACVFLHAQTTPPVVAQTPAQTARQALIEMFVGKASDAFERHLPAVTRKLLVGKGEAPEMSIVKRIAMLGRQWSASGHFETFDEGGFLLVSEPEGTHEKVEVTLEQDSFLGEEEIIEVSIHSFKNGEAEFLPVLPRLSFTMKQEGEIWKLSEVTVSGRVPLEDVDYLNGVRKQQNEMSERMASAQVSTIATAEAAYASQHPDRGYTCKMADLFSAPSSQPASDESSAAAPMQLPEESNGYRFSLGGCGSAPASKFQVTAVPTDSESGMKVFCADQSGKLRFSADGKGPACFSRGELVNPDSANSALLD